MRVRRERILVRRPGFKHNGRRFVVGHRRNESGEYPPDERVGIFRGSLDGSRPRWSCDHHIVLGLRCAPGYRPNDGETYCSDTCHRLTPFGESVGAPEICSTHIAGLKAVGRDCGKRLGRILVLNAAFELPTAWTRIG